MTASSEAEPYTASKILKFARDNEFFEYLPRAIVVPHYDEAPVWLVWPIRLSRLWHRTFVGIPGDTALVSADGRLEVRGTGPVTVWSGLRRNRFGAGEEVRY